MGSNRINWVNRACAAVVLGLLGGVPALGQTYSITGVGGFIPNAINNSGQIVTQLNGQAYLWNGGTMTGLGTLPGYSTGSDAFAINNSGQIVGNSENYNGHTVVLAAFLYSGGTMTNLGPGDANAINNSGQVVGQGSNGHACLWNNGTTTDLGTLGGSGSVAYGINNSGQVVGWANTSSGACDAFLYSGATMTDLGSGCANAINNSGQVVGQGSNCLACLWNNGATTDLGTLGGLSSGASAINNAGQVVGQAETSGGSWDAFLYSNGSMIDLNTLIPSNSGWTLGNASGINDSGQIVGYGAYNGTDEAFLLTPTPEPGSLALLAMGSAGLLMRRR